MPRISQRILFYYCVLLVAFLTLGTVATSFKTGGFFSLALFLPITFYFGHALIKQKGHPAANTLLLKLLFYYNFILVTIMGVMGFVGASSLSQFSSALLFFPLTVYFGLLALPKRSQKPLPAQMILAPVSVEFEPKLARRRALKLKKKIGNGPRLDLDRRMFLKLIGSAGLSLFLFSLFAKRAEAAFFGSVPGPGTVALKDTTGAQIDPAIHHPTEGYKISEVDDSSPAYYGFVEKTGKWFIMKEDSSGAYRYAKGDSNFSTNWTNRGSLTYDYFDAVF